MNYAEIKKVDVANGLGVRVSVFVSGCEHRCSGCFNQETWDQNYGRPFTEETIQEIIDSMNHDYIRGLSLLGGEPFMDGHPAALLPLVKRMKEEYPDKDVWCYTGYQFEELMESCNASPDLYEFLSYIDILVDGKYVDDLKNLSLRFKGSSNQRIIRVKESLGGNVELWEA